MRKSGIPRGEIFFTSKVPPRSMGYEQAKASIDSSFKQTGLDYIDLQVFQSLVCLSSQLLVMVSGVKSMFVLQWTNVPYLRLWTLS